MENKVEIWKEFPNAKGYFISNLGSVFVRKSKKHPNGRLLVQGDFAVDKDGYARISFRDNNGKSTYAPVHRIVALMFIPKIEGKDIVNHKDSNKLNNCVDNLEWVNPKENVYHSYQYGNRKKTLTIQRNSTLTPFQISQISFLRQFYSLKKISQLFNINYSTIKNISIKLNRLTKGNQQPSIYDNDYHINEGSTTISCESTSQANGDGNALPDSIMN